MSTTVFLAMLFSALLHATWNAWVKSRPDPYRAIVALGIGAAWPSLLLLGWYGIPDRAAWGWIAATHPTQRRLLKSVTRSPILSLSLSLS